MTEKPKRLEEISAAVTRYYDWLTDEEIGEERAWGDFAALQFPTDDREYDQRGRPSPAPNPKR
ncbi:MAG: hypothetical protein WBQ10_12715 [Terriglobales bacterium]